MYAVSIPWMASKRQAHCKADLQRLAKGDFHVQRPGVRDLSEDDAQLLRRFQATAWGGSLRTGEREWPVSEVITLAETIMANYVDREDDFPLPRGGGPLHDCCRDEGDGGVLYFYTGHLSCWPCLARLVAAASAV